MDDDFMTIKPILLGVHIQYGDFFGDDAFKAEQQQRVDNMVSLATMFNRFGLGKVVGIELADSVMDYRFESILIPEFKKQVTQYNQGYRSSPLADGSFHYPGMGSTVFVIGQNAGLCPSDTALDLARKAEERNYTVYLVEDAVGSCSIHCAKAWDDAARKKLTDAGVKLVRTAQVHDLAIAARNTIC